MDLLLQIWGGGFYLSNKFLLAIAEGKPQKIKRLLKLAGWSIYILGVPAWVIILISKQNWIAASIEVGGIPSMILGLFNVYKRGEVSSKTFDKVALSVTYVALALGVSYSIYGHEGLNTFTQFLEIGVTVGFLLGSYFLAKNRPSGWLFFMLMNVSMAILMLIQGKTILSVQQLLSLCFVVYGYISTIKIKRVLIESSRCRQQP